MKIPVAIRGEFEARTLGTITQDNLNYIANGGIRNDAQLFPHCISKPIFNIPLSKIRIDCTSVLHLPFPPHTLPLNIGVLARSPYNSGCLYKDLQAP